MAMKRVIVDGVTLNRRTRNMLRVAEQRLGFSPHIYQGSYNGTVVRNSAGTHAGGGAVDLAADKRPNEVVRILREVGFAAWHRLPSQGPWIEHIHAIAIGDGELSPAARQQVRDYRDGLNGLANEGPDNGPRLHPIPTWPIKIPNLLYLNAWRQFRPGNKHPRRHVVAVERIQKILNLRHHANLRVDGNAGKLTRASFNKHYGSFSRATVKKLLAGYYHVV